MNSIILVGPPNTGKTTLFNWLTGFKHKIINYPGSTVLLSVGNMLEKYKFPAKITDTPGIYSLFSKAEDGQTTNQALFKTTQPPTVILVLDAGKLEIQLPLFFQLKESGFQPIVALTMWDILPEHSLVDIKRLKSLLKAQIVPVKGLIGEGVAEIVKELEKGEKSDLKNTTQKVKDWKQEKFNKVSQQSKEIVHQSLSKKSIKEKDENQKQKWKSPFYSHKWDRYFLHPKMGLFLFGCIMFGLFSSIFWLASPFMSSIDQFFSFLIRQTNKSLSFDPQLADFVSQGLLASFGSVLIFVPQIFILFVGISLLEDTGYLARAVALMDGPFSKMGLSGRAFVPLLSGYACAIPSLLLTRSLSSKRERLMSFFSIPFMSCSARLPVYALLLSFLFYGQSAWKPGLALSLIYITSFFLGMVAVLILNSLLKKEDRDIFLLDLPLYRRPVLTKVLQNAGKQTKHYVVKAGPAIFVVALAIWFLTHFPLQPELSPAEEMQQSYAAQIGRFVEPLFRSMGVDWRVGTALIAAFAAREVFVSALVLVFSLTAFSEVALTQSLLEVMKSASHSDGSLVFTTASVISLVIFFMFSLQCLSTTAVVYKESKSLKLAVFQFLILNILAYFISVLVYQGLNLAL